MGDTSQIARIGRLLRPAKIRNAVRRRWFERRLARVQVEPREPLVHLGTDYGGWFVPDGLIGPDWLCYSIGAGGDISFDLELIRRYGCRVRMFEPSPAFAADLHAQAAAEPRLTFHPWAIAPSDGELRMWRAEDPRSGALSAANLQNADDSLVLPAKSLATTMAELGDHRVDLLKADVEGSEYDLLPTLDLATMGVRVLCVELHHTGSVRQARAAIDRLGAAGFRLAHRKDPTSFTFIRSG